MILRCSSYRDEGESLGGMLIVPEVKMQCHSPVMMLGDIQNIDPLQRYSPFPAHFTPLPAQISTFHPLSACRFSVDYSDQPDSDMYGEFIDQLQTDLDKEKTYSEVFINFVCWVKCCDFTKNMKIPTVSLL